MTIYQMFVDDDGTMRWYNEDLQLDREGGPAIAYADGRIYWYRHGRIHREDGPAEFLADGTQKWYFNGNFHREGGPAVECADGTKYWYCHDKLHREDGPAVEHADGRQQWWIDGVQITDADAIAAIEAKQQVLLHAPKAAFAQSPRQILTAPKITFKARH